MAKKISVLVLEDSDERIKWLEQVLPTETYEVIWTKTSPDFLVSVKAYPDHALVILDHDLDLIGSASEVGDGTHAAKELETVKPVIVWSINPVRAPEMVQILKVKGIHCGWIPFYNKMDLERVVCKCLGLTPKIMV